MMLSGRSAKQISKGMFGVNLNSSACCYVFALESLIWCFPACFSLTQTIDVIKVHGLDGYSLYLCAAGCDAMLLVLGSSAAASASLTSLCLYAGTLTH